jgi:hypothetical protein
MIWARFPTSLKEWGCRSPEGDGFGVLIDDCPFLIECFGGWIQCDDFVTNEISMDTTWERESGFVALDGTCGGVFGWGAGGWG